MRWLNISKWLSPYLALAACNGHDSASRTAGEDAVAGSAGGESASTDSTGAGAPGECLDRASTETRPQLSADEAAAFSVASYFAMTGNVAAKVDDPWDPTGGLPQAAELEPDFVVALDGSGTHETVQSAISAAGGSERQYILIEPGTYRETVTIPGSAPPLTLYGADADASLVVIVDGKSAATSGGTSDSATFTAQANGFQALNLTIENDFDTPESGSNLQAVALKTTGDQVVLENVRLHGFQDTLYLDSASSLRIARVYIKGSHIEGDTDFIFGRATGVIEDSTIHYLHSRKGSGSGIILAPSTHVDHEYGFLVLRSRFTADAGAPEGVVYLGRSWDASSTSPTPNGQAVIRESALGAHLRQAAPWAAAATSGREYSPESNRFSEYCNRGPGAG